MNIENLTAPISRTTGNLATKTHGEAFHISASNWEKNGGFNITFKWFSTLVVCMYFVWKTPKSPVFLQGTVFTNFKIAAFPSHGFILYLTKIGLFI